MGGRGVKESISPKVLSKMCFCKAASPGVALLFLWCVLFLLFLFSLAYGQPTGIVIGVKAQRVFNTIGSNY